MKPIVKYRESSSTFIEEGKRAFVCPIDHWDNKNVSNTKVVMTTLVLSHNIITGEFETENTKYIRNY